MQPTSPELIVVHTTVDSEAVAKALMQRVIQERAAACAALSAPCRSSYHWKGALEHAVEWQLSFKTRLDLFDRVAAIIKSLHPYELPEIIATPIVCADPDYAEWILAQTSRS